MATSALNVLVTMPFSDSQLDRLRRVSPGLRVTREDPAGADYSRADVLYAGSPPLDLGRAPNLQWVQLHMAGVDALAEHPLYAASAIPLVTASGVHASTIAEYAITVLLALAHHVPRMVQWQARREPNAARAELEKKTLDYMATMPAWKDHPRVRAR